MKNTKPAIRMGLTFLAVGASGAGGYVVLSSVLVKFGMVSWVASLLSYAVFIPIIYLAQKTLTFRTDVPHRSAFSKYLTIQLLGLSLSALLPYLLGKFTSFPPVLAFVLVIVIITGINFVLQKKWAFKQPQSPSMSTGSENGN